LLIKARPLNSPVFSALCNDMGSDHVKLLHSALVIKGQTIDTLFSLLTIIFTNLGDVFSLLTDLNLGLHELSATIFNTGDRIEVMIKKCELFSVCINNTQVFPSLYDFFVCK
jgi:hypothetical protein